VAVEMGSFYQHQEGATALVGWEQGGPAAIYDYLPTLLCSPLLAGARQKV
jgi:hypothetical protein